MLGLKKAIARNLRQPTGLFGKMVGVFMNKGNDSMNRFAINFLNPQKDDHILEIGFGNGKYITEIAGATQNGFVAGVDFSETMVNEARKRNERFIKQGIVEIKLGVVNKIPFEISAFDKVFTVNTIYFWPNPEKDLKEIYRVLKPNGMLIIAFRSKERMKKFDLKEHGFRFYEPKEVAQLMLEAGFRDIRIESSQDKYFCVIAVK